MPVEITHLQVEHYESPLGIFHASPRLSWRFNGTDKDWVQDRYNIQVHRGDKVEEYNVKSRDSVLVPWPTHPLRSRERVKVVVTSHGTGGSKSQQELWVEAGLLDADDWVARPVSAAVQDKDKAKRPFRLRKEFDISDTTSARLYITAMGVYEAYLNGKRIGQEYLAPGWTSYDHYQRYQVYDITSLLKPGKNCLGAWVAEGWYAGRLRWGAGVRNAWGERTGLLAQLEVSGKVVCKTDEQGWEWSYGAITESEIYDGEAFDSTVDDTAWKSAGGKDGEWKAAEGVPMPKGKLVIAEAPPVREIERIAVKEIIKTPSGKTILDLGQNFAGYLEILSPPSATSGMLTLSHAEVLEHGELGVRPLRAAKPIDRITLGGDLKCWKPKFTFHGFRYVQVDGWDNIRSEDVVGVVLASDLERTGHFECSHKLLNQLHSNVYYSTRSNTISVPTDCPQRDERLGWTGDIQVFTPTLGFLFDSTGFLADWLKDVYVDQKAADGVVPLVVPDVLHSYDLPQAIWGDVSVLCPWDVYTASHDRALLEEQWASMTLWLDKGVQRDPETKLWDREMYQLADWLAPAADPHIPNRGPTSNWLVADAYLIHTTRVAAKIAKVIGQSSKASEYEADAAKLLRHFHDFYVTPRSQVQSDTQTALALMLHFDLLDEGVPEQKVILSKRLGQLVTSDFWQVSTGFAGTPIILQTLANNGMLHHAYRMLQCRDCPSWLSPILLGATTIWERWDSMLADGSINPGEMTSFNHYALGAVASFLHSYVGGISPLSPGWQNILIKPQPGGSVTSAKVGYLSPYGQIKCDWEIKDGKLNVEVAIPPNCQAVIDLSGKKETIGSGEYSYVVAWEADARFPPEVEQPRFAKPVDKDWVR